MKAFITKLFGCKYQTKSISSTETIKHLQLFLSKPKYITKENSYRYIIPSAWMSNILYIISNKGEIPVKIELSNQSFIDVTKESASFILINTINSNEVCLIIREFMISLLKYIEVDYVLKIPFKNNSKIKLNECLIYNAEDFKKKKLIDPEPEVIVTKAVLFDDNFSIDILSSRRLKIDIIEIKNISDEVDNREGQQLNGNITKEERIENRKEETTTTNYHNKLHNNKEVNANGVNDRSSSLILNNNTPENNILSLVNNKSIKRNFIEEVHLDNYPSVVLSPKGLNNPSVYCFMNTCFQCLLSIPELNGYFVQELYLKEIKSKKKPIASNAFRDLILKYESSDDAISPSRSIYHLCHSFLERGHQHDCQEFLRRFLSSIQEELNHKAKYTFSNDITKEKAWEIYREVNPSFIDTLFTGLMCSSVKCSICNHTSKTFDPFLDISVSIKHSPKETLMNCLMGYFQEEQIKSDYKCDKCKRKTNITKKLEIVIYPPILTIQIKRFEDMHKLNNHVSFNNTITLKTDQYDTDGNEGKTYKLFAIAVHLGFSISLGHYVAYAKRNDQWYHFSDSNVGECREADVLKSEAYLLFYKLI